VRCAGIDIYRDLTFSQTSGIRAYRRMNAWVPCIIPRFDGASSFALPLWIPIAIGLFAAYRLLPESIRPGRCPTCAHDLSGSPKVEVQKEHVRCAECGTVCEREVSNEKPPAPAGGSLTS
jgi:hypothetical protein